LRRLHWLPLHSLRIYCRCPILLLLVPIYRLLRTLNITYPVTRCIHYACIPIWFTPLVHFTRLPRTPVNTPGLTRVSSALQFILPGGWTFCLRFVPHGWFDGCCASAASLVGSGYAVTSLRATFPTGSDLQPCVTSRLVHTYALHRITFCRRLCLRKKKKKKRKERKKRGHV